MRAITLFSVKFFFGGSAVLMGLLAAALNFWSGAQTKLEQSESQKWFGSALEIVEQSSWRQLPALVVTTGIGLLKLAIRFPYAWAVKFGVLWLMLSPLLLGVSIALDIIYSTSPSHARLKFASASLLLLLMFTLAIYRSLRKELGSAWLHVMDYGVKDPVGIGASWPLLFPAAMPVLVYWCIVVIRTPLPWSTLAVALLFPLCGFYFMMFVVRLFALIRSLCSLLIPLPPLRDVPEIISLSGFFLVLSMLITLLAFMLGHIFLPEAWVPKTIQMVLSNALFDVLTIALTLWLFHSAVDAESFTSLARALPQSKAATIISSIARHELFGFGSRLVRAGPVWKVVDEPHVQQKRMSLVVAVLLDILGALTFACASLWCGLAFSNRAVSFQQTLHILMARSTDGTRWELGPYFWVMHTTLFPTLLYGGIVLFSLVAKAAMPPTKWFLARAQHPDINPIGLAARLFALLGGLFGIIAFIVDMVDRLRT